MGLTTPTNTVDPNAVRNALINKSKGFDATSLANSTLNIQTNREFNDELFIPKDIGDFRIKADQALIRDQDKIPLTPKPRGYRIREFNNTYDPGTVSYYWENAKENFEREEDMVSNEIKEVEDEFNNDIPKELSDTNFMKHDWSFILNGLRWVLNAVFIASPINFFLWVMVFWHYMVQIFLNKWWAHGNLFLISKTIFITLQTISLVPVIYELDFMIRHLKFFRFLNLMQAVFFLLEYLGGMGVWIFEVYNPPSWTNFDLVYLYSNMMVASILMLDTWTLPVNVVLIVKELSMEFFQFLKKNAGTSSDDVSLGLVDITDFFVTLSFFLNPFNLAVFLWKFVTGKVDTKKIGEQMQKQN